MGTDFFDELGETLSRTAREFGERAESLYETQKLRTKIAGEERAITKAMAELGKSLYRSYRNGRDLTEEQRAWCEQIDQHKEVIERFKAEMAGRKGKKICPSCGETVDLSVSFCPHCGAACTVQEQEEKTEDAAAEADIDAKDPAESSEEKEEDTTDESAAAGPEESEEEEPEKPEEQEEPEESNPTEPEVELSEPEGDLSEEKEDTE